MILKRIVFRNALLPPLGFFGGDWENYKRYERIPGFGLEGGVFVSKTMTLKQEDATEERLSKRTYTNFIKGFTLNATGLVTPGAEVLFKTGEWQKRTEPFFLSFSAVGATGEERITEAWWFSLILKKYLPKFKTKVGLILKIHNLSSPREITEMLDIIAWVLPELPLVIEVNAMASVTAVKKITDTGLCDAILVSGEIPWGMLCGKPPHGIDWYGLFGTHTSPLEHLGGGALSGWPTLGPTVKWIERARIEGIKITVIGGSGISREQDVDIIKKAGANAMSTDCCLATVRPWRLEKIIAQGGRTFNGYNN